MAKWSAAQKRQVLHENFKLWEEKFRIHCTECPNVIGLDFSMTSTGMVALKYDGELIDTSATKTSAKTGTTRERVGLHTSNLKDLLDYGHFRIIASEDINVGRNFTALKQLSMVTGAVYQVINDRCNPFTYMMFCNVSSLKLAAAGDGGAKKGTMQMEVYAKWGVKTATDDEADAMVAAQLARKMPHFWEIYGQVTDSCDDLADALMDMSKNRHTEFYQRCEGCGIPKEEVDALVGIYTGGSGFNQLRENDRDFYYEARDRIKKI